MTFASTTLYLSGIGVAVTGYLAVIFLRDPQNGLQQTTHHAENLPSVMTDRYLAMTALAAGATFYGDFKVIAFLFATFAFMGFADAFIYARAGKSISKHMIAGGAAMIVVIVAILAQITNGAA
ncbi:MAG: hypothetical protein Q9M48_09435 [Rhodobacterales bacterium]|nr:hypothetical protein [Rhodobacterales bacterium]